MPIGFKPFSVTRHAYTKADAITAITAAVDDLVTGDADFAVIRDTAVALVTGMIGLAAEPLSGQEIYITTYGRIDSWEIGRPDEITGAQCFSQVNVAAEL